ncbi:MAG: cardiolipin synthase B [Gemmatimonas sp.]|nr:cardiolipin synthase B [Gemmatimonas sp.]
MHAGRCRLMVMGSSRRHDRPGPVCDDGAWLERAFSRVTGAPLVGGNRIRLLQDGFQNYPAWLRSIRRAERTVHFETYSFSDDHVGRVFAEAFVAKAREGVSVRLIYDWVGSLRKASRRLWREMEDAGVEIRCFNRPHPLRPHDLLHRDHRKLLSVDGTIGYVAGLCVGECWVGDPANEVSPWRDTGVEISGPAVAGLERAFAAIWAAASGHRRVTDLLPTPDAPPSAGPIALRVVAGEPRTTRMLRLDYLVAAAARETLWITDPYFAGTTPYIQALRAAARDGVDVRLLVPGSSDLPFLTPISLAAYRPLLEAGVRTYQWNGLMLHAKSSVTDGEWGRVGSTNLNLASWLGNYELDVVVHDRQFAGDMQRMYLEDLAGATELVLDSVGRRGRSRVNRPPQDGSANRPNVGRRRSALTGLSRRTSNLACGAVRIGNAFGSAMSDPRSFDFAEDRFIVGAGLLLLGLAVVAWFSPRTLTIPASLLSTWFGVALLVRGVAMSREARRKQLVGEINESQRSPAAPKC